MGALLHWRWLCSTFEKDARYIYSIYDFPAKQTSCKGTIHYIIYVLGLSRTVDYYNTVYKNVLDLIRGSYSTVRYVCSYVRTMHGMHIDGCRLCV